MSNEYESLYARYRKAAGLTQERAAELLGVAVRTLAAWERGESTPPNMRVLSMVDVYASPTLAIEHLRYTNIIAYDVLPPLRRQPLAQAVCSLMASVRKLESLHAGDRLLEIAADGKVDEIEQADFDQLLMELEPVMAAVLSLKYAAEG